MPALSSLKRPDPVKCQVTFGGEVVNVTFDRNRMTQRWVKEIQAGIAAEDIETAARSLTGILMSWDIQEEDGTPTPITVEVLTDLPIGFLGALDAAIGDAGILSSEEGNASLPSAPGQSSDSTVDSPSSLNGSETLTSPVPSASPS